MTQRTTMKRLVASRRVCHVAIVGTLLSLVAAGRPALAVNAVFAGHASSIDAATTQPYHQGALEADVTYLSRGLTNDFGFPLSLSYGLLSWVEVSGGVGGQVEGRPGQTVGGFADVNLGVKIKLLDEERFWATQGFEFGVKLPIASRSRGFGTGRTDYDLTWLVTKDFTDRLTGHFNVGHTWIGIRFQTIPRCPPMDIIIHARMWDQDNARQQEALGILGVNLIHAAFHHHHEPEALIRALMDDLTRDRMEVDMIKFSGLAFAGIDNRLMSLQLVQQRLTNAALFNPDGEVIEPAELLYHKPVLIERGSFRPVTNVTLDMLDRSLQQMRREPYMAGCEPVVLMEMTLRNLLSLNEEIEHADFLARADMLGALGKTVMISNYSRFHNVTTYLRRYTHDPVVMVLGVPTLVKLFDEKYYADLEGGLLEALGRLFQGAVKLYIYPWKNNRTDELVTADKFKLPDRLSHLYAHLFGNHFIEPIREYTEADLSILPGDVSALIQKGDPQWEKMVPGPVVNIIKEKKLFGYQG